MRKKITEARKRITQAFSTFKESNGVIPSNTPENRKVKQCLSDALMMFDFIT